MALSSLLHSTIPHSTLLYSALLYPTVLCATLLSLISYLSSVSFCLSVPSLFSSL